LDKRLVDQRLQNIQIQSVLNFIMNIISNYYPLRALDLPSLIKDFLVIPYITLFWKWPDMSLQTFCIQKFLPLLNHRNICMQGGSDKGYMSVTR